MPTIACVFKLAADKDDAHTPRRGFVDLSGTIGSGKWVVSGTAGDSRLQIPVEGGEWGVNPDNGVSTAFLFDKEFRIHLQLAGVPNDIMSRVSCGFSWGGTGIKNGPPDSAIVYNLSFLCV